MCCDKSCEALPASSADRSPPRSLSDERAARLPGSVGGARDLLLPEPSGTLRAALTTTSARQAQFCMCATLPVQGEDKFACRLRPRELPRSACEQFFSSTVSSWLNRSRWSPIAGRVGANHQGNVLDRRRR